MAAWRRASAAKVSVRTSGTQTWTGRRPLSPIRGCDTTGLDPIGEDADAADVEVDVGPDDDVDVDADVDVGADADQDDDAERRAHSRRVLAWLAAGLVFAVMSALALVGVFAGVGPFGGMRSVFVVVPVWGTCDDPGNTDLCHDIPLSTIEQATGVAFPEDRTIIDSSFTKKSGMVR